MGIFFSVAGIGLLYVILNLFPWLHHHTLFTVNNFQVSWFAGLMTVGSLFIVKSAMK